MIVFRKRLIFWLIKAYLKKLGKRIFLFFILGLGVFFVLYLLFKSNIIKIPIIQNESIGMVGAYTLDNLPPPILEQMSLGLTSISVDEMPKPSIAKSWKIENNGKKYTFFLRNDLHFTDGTQLTSDLINYNFSDAKVIKPDRYTIIFILKDSYSPFLVTVSKPIFKKGFVGVGEYKLKNLKLNGNFVVSLTLISTKNSHKTIDYQFYPSIVSLKTAFVLGEVSKINKLTDLKFKDTSFDKFSKLKIDKKINYNRLMTIFYNTQDPSLSDKKIRNGLSYALPDAFIFGKRADSLYSPSSWVYTNQYAKTQDLTHAKILLSMNNSEKALNLKIKTFSKYEDVAKEIKNAWGKVGIKSKIEIIDSVPSDDFQVFLGDFYLSEDPDQYSLWHSNQENNITNFKNLRIDKLLEDGRKIIDMNQRKKNYVDFQKYMMDESPASFLYFPYEYEVNRK